MSIVAADTFTRANVATPSWGSATDTVNAWATLGGITANNLQVASNAGQIFSSSATQFQTLGAALTPADCEGLCRITFSTVTGGASDTGGIMLRAQNSSNYYIGRYRATIPEVSLAKRVVGTTTNLTGAVTVTLTAGQAYWFRMRVQGTTLSLRYWQDGTSEPSAWTVQITDSSLTAAGFGGLFAFGQSATGVKFDHFQLDDLLTVPAPAAAITASTTTPAGFIDLTPAPALAATASAVGIKTTGATATGAGTGFSTFQTDPAPHNVTWTTLGAGFTNTTGPETVIQATNAAGDGFRLGSIPAYGGMPISAVFELLGSGGVPTVVNPGINAEDPGNQMSLKTTFPDGHQHVYFNKAGVNVFVGTEDVQNWTRTELAPVGTPLRRYIQGAGTDSNGVAWTFTECIWPTGFFFSQITFVVPSTISLTSAGGDSFEIALPAGLLPATGATTQQGPWVAPGLAGFSGDTTRSFAGTIAPLATSSPLPDGTIANTTGEPDFLAFLPSTVANGGQIGTLANQVRGDLVTKFTRWIDLMNYAGGVPTYPGGGYSSLANTSRIKSKWGASPSTLNAGTYTIYALEVYSPLVTPAGAGTLAQAQANMLAVVADYLQPGTPTVTAGTPSSLTYNGRSTGCFRLDQGCYEVTVTAANRAAIQLDLGPNVTANIRYSPRFRFPGLTGTFQANGSDFTVLWGATTLTAGTDYTIAVDTVANVAYVHLQRDVVNAGAGAGQLTLATLTLLPSVTLVPVTPSGVSAGHIGHRR